MIRIKPEPFILSTALDCTLDNTAMSSALNLAILLAICRLFNNFEALQISKKNVERNYAVVGVTETINMTLTVAEKKNASIL